MGQDKANPEAAILSWGDDARWLGWQAGNQKMIDAARLIEKAVEDGFADGGLRPMEFGGDMGLKDMTKAVLTYQ